MSIPFPSPVSARNQSTEERDLMMTRMRDLSASYTTEGTLKLQNGNGFKPVPVDIGQCKPNDIFCILKRHLIGAFPNLSDDDIQSTVIRFKLTPQTISRRIIQEIVSSIRAQSSVPFIPMPANINLMQQQQQSLQVNADDHQQQTQEHCIMADPAVPSEPSFTISLPPSAGPQSGHNDGGINTINSLPEASPIPMPITMTLPPPSLPQFEHTPTLNSIIQESKPSKSIQLTLMLSSDHTSLQCKQMIDHIERDRENLYTNVSLNVVSVSLDPYEFNYLFIQVNDYYAIYKATAAGELLGGLCEIYAAHDSQHQSSVCIRCENPLKVTTPLSDFKERGLNISMYNIDGELIDPSKQNSKIMILFEFVFT